MIRCIAICATVLSLTISADAVSSGSAYALVAGSTSLVSKRSQKRALIKPMLKVCTAKQGNRFEPSV
jgi:hypothetical protein